MTEAVLRQHFPSPSDEGFILACGPDEMMHKTIKPMLADIGWDVEKSLVIL